MLKLVLQTQEGQQIEVTVSPEDTFADLQRQYESPENPGLPELLRHLITNGTDVDQQTKVFDYVTNCNSTEWLVEESLENMGGLESVDTLQTIMEETPSKECCVENCSNTELTAPEKVFFPLPTDKNRLSSWLIGIGKSELSNFGDESMQAATRSKQFVCADHFAPHQFLKGTNQVLKRRACPSLTPHGVEGWTYSPPIEQNSLHVKTEPNLPKFGEQKDPDDPDSLNASMMDLFDVFKDANHPGVLCRLCGEQTVAPVYLFPTKDQRGECSVADKINLCLPITVNSKDPLPKQVCADCLDKLNTCHQLAKTCLETEDRLKAMFESKKFRVKDAEDKQCPLCVFGSMKTVTKSGIYRKDKADSVPEFMKNSSARTRQVSPSKNVNPKAERSSSVGKEPLQELDDVISVSPTVIKSFENEDIATDSERYLSRDELSCSICHQKEESIKALTCHAKEHDDYPCTICSNVSFQTINEQQLHFLWHGVNDGCCNICSMEWSNAQEAAEHIKLCKLEFWTVECARCGEKFPNVEAGHNHACRTSEKEEEGENENEDEDRFECDQCGKKFSRKTDLNAHLKSHEKRETILYNCSFCSKQFTRKGSLQKHISSLHISAIESIASPKCFKCRKCDQVFTTAVNAEGHISEKHFGQLIMADATMVSDQFTAEEMNLSRVYVCEYCERCYAIPSSLHEHRQNEHREDADYQCNVCNSTFKTYKSLVRHKTLHVRENELEDLGIKQYYLCNYCNKTFLHYGSLTVHNSQHQEPLPYLCRLCNFQFETYKEVAEHRNTTHPYQSMLHERPNNLYHCQYCEKCFAHEVALVKHIRMHTGERPYKCSICGKGFSQTSGLYTHLKVHSDLRPYTCPQCPQTFKIKGDRDNHVKKHSGDRPYKCEFCEKAFMTQHVYSQHRKIHTNERPYKCDVCGEAFRRSHVLTVHMRRHTGEKPHMCDLCPKAYRQRGDLLKHKKIQHGVGANSSSCSVGVNSIAEFTPSADVSSTESTAVFLPI